MIYKEISGKDYYNLPDRTVEYLILYPNEDKVWPSPSRKWPSV